MNATSFADGTTKDLRRMNANEYRHLAYLDALMERLDTIVPSSQRHLYHLIFGSTIIGSYKTAEEMMHADEHDHKFIVCVRYFPLSFLITKVQALWRGYHYRTISKTVL